MAKVFWRKLHPDAQYSGSSGGYPLSLEHLYEWMLDHQDLNPPRPDVVDPGDPRRANPYASTERKRERSK